MASNQIGTPYITSQPLADRFIGWENIILFSFVCVAVHICIPTPENVCPSMCARADQRLMTELGDSARLTGPWASGTLLPLSPLHWGRQHMHSLCESAWDLRSQCMCGQYFRDLAVSQPPPSHFLQSKEKKISKPEHQMQLKAYKLFPDLSFFQALF